MAKIHFRTSEKLVKTDLVEKKKARQAARAEEHRKREEQIAFDDLRRKELLDQTNASKVAYSKVLFKNKIVLALNIAAFLAQLFLIFNK